MKRFRFKSHLPSKRGAAAVEIAVFLMVLAPLLLNLTALGAYAFEKMQVENAAQAAAQAAWATCLNPSCPTGPMNTAISGAIAGSALGAAVTETHAAGYYCPDSTSQLVASGTPSVNCTQTGNLPGYYVSVTASYQARATFMKGTVASLLNQTISKTTWSRIA